MGLVILLRLSEGGARRMIYPAGENLFIKVYHWAAIISYNLSEVNISLVGWRSWLVEINTRFYLSML